LVTIPVSLHPAIKREELKFRLLRKSDQSPVNYKRVAEADGKEVFNQMEAIGAASRLPRRL
jgi:DNA end-binding protein Ku